jgi:hypothetical protein
MQAKMGDTVLAEVVVDALPFCFSACFSAIRERTQLATLRLCSSSLRSSSLLDGTEGELPLSCLLVPSMHQIGVTGIIHAGKDGR